MARLGADGSDKAPARGAVRSQSGDLAVHAADKRVLLPRERVPENRVALRGDEQRRQAGGRGAQGHMGQAGVGLQGKPAGNGRPRPLGIPGRELRAGQAPHQALREADAGALGQVPGHDARVRDLRHGGPSRAAPPIKRCRQQRSR